MYEIQITEDALFQIHDKLEYLARKCSEQAYEAVHNDMSIILDYIRENPYYFSVYDKDPAHRRAHFQRHRYKFIYRIDDEAQVVYVKAFLHDLEDR